MKRLHYTLLSEGSSDKMLIPLINWAVHRCDIGVDQVSWADLSQVTPKPEGLAERVERAIELYPCDVLFIHRDADREPLAHRIPEIRTAPANIDTQHVPVIPVRMMEAWFLHDEQAIRQASGNPRGKVALNLPSIGHLESLPNPKETLIEALLTATETTGRNRERRKRGRFRMRARVAELIDDFSPLLGLAAFQHFLTEMDQVFQQLFPKELEP